MFAKQHYEFVAQVLNKNRPPKYSDQYGIWKNMVCTFSDRFQNDNDRFEVKKFTQACGVD